jgi:hypothetical protein
MTSDESKTKLKMKRHGTASPALALGGRAEKTGTCAGDPARQDNYFHEVR